MGTPKVRIRILLLGLCLTAAVPGFAQQWVVPGASSVSEFYLRFSLENYGLLLSQCYVDQKCLKGIEDLAAELDRARPYEAITLQFKSTLDMGSHLYMMDEMGRMTVNRDLLYIARNGTLEPWTYPDALEFLTRIFGERLAWETGRSLRMGKRMTDFALDKSDFIPIPGGEVNQFALALIRRPRTTMVIEDRGNQSLSTLEVPFQNRLSCGPSTGLETPLSALQIVAARWKPMASARDYVSLTIEGCLEYECEVSPGRYRKFISNYIVQVDAHRHRTEWVLKRSTLRIRQDRIRPRRSTGGDEQTVCYESGMPDNEHLL